MYKEFREEAKKKVQQKIAFYTCAIVFGGTTLVLLMLSFYLPSIRFWLKLPIPVFMMVLAIMYLSIFGLPYTGLNAEDWKEEEIEKEMQKLYQRQRTQLPPVEELSESDKLELKELERLQKKWDSGEDFV